MKNKPVIGLIVANRGFFPAHLVVEGRKRMIEVLETSRCDVVVLAEDAGTQGSVEISRDAAQCAALFRSHPDRISGVVVTLPNFGDERAVAETLRRARLDVPVLVHAEPDSIGAMGKGGRRDSFCGKISVCNNLTQYGIPFSLTRRHTVAADSAEFAGDLRGFLQTCSVVHAARGARIGAFGARPAAFNTVRFSEKILERFGVSTITVDLSDIFAVADSYDAASEPLRSAMARLRSYSPEAALGFGGDVDAYYQRQARLLAALEYHVQEHELDAVSVQCWTAMEEVYGVAPCHAMSYLSDNGLPAACETDVLGAFTMLLLHAATNSAPTILDWNNNFGDDEDACVVFHCGNLPQSTFQKMQVTEHPILSETLPPERTRGTCEGCLQPGETTFLRLSTGDWDGTMRGYIGNGTVTMDNPETFGAVGVLRVERLQELMQIVCRQGFEHHVCMAYGSAVDPLCDALSTYLGVEMIRHR